MTTNFNANHEIMKMKTKVNCPKIAKEILSGSTRVFQRTSPATSVLLLIQKHFPHNHKYHKIFNKNIVKISYSYMANIKSIINMHNKEVITENKTQAVNCNCVNKPDCSPSNQCQITNIIYKAKITSNLRHYNRKIFYRTNEGTFKQQYGNHKKSFNHKKPRTDTELSK